MNRRCNHAGCPNEGHDVYDWYGIYAGRWCEDHEDEAPGQWPYDGPDTEPLEEEDDGPAGDYLNDYWFTAGGPDEPPDWSDEA